MNERIKDIIGQNCVSEYYAGTLCWRFSESQLEKFAQLIVQECASRVTSKADRWGNMTDEIINECILECATDLKQHFGVEE